jgi:hypothetical protein
MTRGKRKSNNRKSPRRARMFASSFALLTALAVTPAWASETVLHSFNPYAQGAYPQANVCLGPGNNL